MRVPVLLLALLTVSACASPGSTGRGPPVVKGVMPLEILRAEGQPPRMGEAQLQAGGYRKGEPFMFNIYFDTDSDTLGPPRSVSWQMTFGDYCRDRPSSLQSILTGPSGQIWRVQRVPVPAGPDRAQDWSSGGFGNGYGGPDTQALLDAAAAGGRFTLALEDDEGQRHNVAVIDTLTPERRRRLFAENVAAFRATDPATVPLASDMLLMVEPEPVILPSPPRPCPTR